MRERSLWLSCDARAFEARGNDGKVLRFEFVEIIAGDRIETGALPNHGCKAVAVRKQHAPFNAIRESDECGEFVPSQGRTARAEFCLVGVMFAELRFKDAIDAFIANGQSQSLAQRMRDARSRPDVLRFLDGDSGEIRLGENLEGVPAFTFCRKPANAPFQFAKTCQPVEKPALKIAPRLWMRRRHYWILLVISRFSSPSIFCN